MKNPWRSRACRRALAAALTAAACGPLPAADVTFFCWSDTHYEVEDTAGRAKVNLINNLPGKSYPASVGGTVAVPRGVILQGDLIDDGGNNALYPTQWANWIADFSVAGGDAGGVHGAGRCRFPAFEGLGNHDLNGNLFVYDQIKQRNVTRQNLGLISNISTNGYHYSWDWDGVHFVNLNLFCGNIWRGEADGYGPVHDPKDSRDFLIQDLLTNVGNSGRPVVVNQHYQPTNEGWWTRSAIDKWYKAMQDYNVIAVLTGHQGGANNATWRGLTWSNSNGSLDIYRISPDNKLTILEYSDAGAWSATVVQKNIYTSYASSGIAAAVNNGDWATNITNTSATLSGKLLYQGISPTEVTVYWGTTDGGTTVGNWQNSRNLGVQTTGNVFTTDVTGLQPWTTYYYRVRATNSQGSVWAATSIDFKTAGNLPSAWGTRFVGYEQRSGGGAHEASGLFTLVASGRDIGTGGFDDFQYAYRGLSGDGQIVARIASMGTTSRNPKAGVMLREALGDDSRFVAVMVSKNEGIRLMSRSGIGGNLAATGTTTLAAPYWVKVVRNGNTFTGYHSPDGNAWTQVGSPLTISMASDVFAGLAHTAGNADGSLNQTATFDSVSVTGDNLPMPPTIGNIADQTIDVGGTTGPLAFTVGDMETPPAQLTLSGTSSNTSLIPNANIVFGGSGTDRTVTVTPVAGQTGIATITVTVNDGSLTASDTFQVTVLAGQVFAGQWQVVSNHGGSPQSLAMTETPIVECRQAGIRKLEVTFSAPVSVSNPATAFTITGVNSSGAINLGSLGITASASASGNVLSLTFANGSNPVALPDAAKWRFTLNPAVISGAGGLVLMPSAATTRLLTGLVGDVDGNGRVSGLDLNRIANAGTYSPGIPASLRADVTGDAVINQADIDAAWANRSKRVDTLATP